MAYFTVMHGLRGCYMPDSVFIIRADTRRELKECLESEASYIRDAGAIGLSKRAIARHAAAAWRDRRRMGAMQLATPYKPEGCDQYFYGLFTVPATRAEYLAQEGDCA